MSAERPWPRWLLAAIRWVARISALLLFLMVGALLIGEGPPDVLEASAKLKLQTLAFGALWLGLMVGWFREGVGAAMVLGGLASFYLINLAASGHLPGGAFPLFWAPGTLYLAGALARRSLQHARSAEAEAR